MKIPQSEAFTFCIEQIRDQKKLKITAEQYYRHFLRTKCAVGAKGTMYLSFAKPTRSEQQLRYYFVVVGLLADSLGYTSEEMHNVLISIKFGTKKVNLFGRTVEVRKSVSNADKFPKGMMIELIDFALEKCMDENVIVPDMESLGYIRN